MQSNQCLHSSTNTGHRQLLFELKKSVDLWFLSRRDSLDDSVEDGESFFQVLVSVKNILLDGFNKESARREGGTSDLIAQLDWLTPTVYDEGKSFNFPHLVVEDSLVNWIYTNLQKFSLCARLQLLVADYELLTTFYANSAFLHSDRYATALFICLSAVELNQSSLVSQIDASLYVENNLVIAKHKRSNSHPHFSISPRKASHTSLLRVDSTDGLMEAPNTRKIYGAPCRLRKWKSVPNFGPTVIRRRPRSQTFSQTVCSQDHEYYKVDTSSFSTPPESDLPSYSYNVHSSDNHVAPSTSRSCPDDLVPINLVKCDDIKIYFDQGHEHDRKASPDERPDPIDYDSPPKAPGLLSCISANLFSLGDAPAKDNLPSASSSFSNSNDFMSAFYPQEGKKLKRHSHSMFDSFDEDPPNIFQQRLPTNGQSLASFLQSVHLSRNNTELERENAHFSISEAMICVIEKMKCSKAGHRKQSTQRNESDKSLNRVKRRNGRIMIGRNKYWDEYGSSVQLSASSFSEVEDSLEDSDRCTDGSVDDRCDDLMKELMQPKQSINDHTAYAEWGGENALEALSAEGVALSLISRFSDYQMPRATDFTWLVSRKDAPQDLLPLPTSTSVDADENFAHPTIRGTRDWAPPRQQIIFTNHQIMNRKQLLQQQNFRCTGCGMRVSRAYINRFRYCTYLGKYHCTGCHRNQMSIIPAKVLEKWDFCYYPVSVFAYRLLEQIWTYPLFSLPDLNPNLYTKIKNLSISRQKRVQLKYIQDFIVTCRFAQEEKKLYDQIAAYITLEPDKWSMFDFVATKDGSFVKTVSDFISKCEEHVLNCELCSARGFICEVCPKKQIIFPWQSRVKRCDHCGTCFHQKCWENIVECVKCQRLRIRKQKVT